MPKIQKFRAKVLKNEYIADDIIFMSLERPSEFSFKAGQFVNIAIRKGDKVKHTPYSILNPPSEGGKIDLCLDIIETGFSSPALRDSTEGTELEVSGPYGFFVLDEKTPHQEHWFIGTGTGVVPLYSMIMEHLEKSPDKKFVLVFGAKTRNDLVFHEKFAELANKYPNFAYIPTLTREQWSGRKGRVQEHLNGDLTGKSFYICGLKEIVQDVRQLLQEKGVAGKDINFERYN